MKGDLYCLWCRKWLDNSHPLAQNHLKRMQAYLALPCADRGAFRGDMVACAIGTRATEIEILNLAQAHGGMQGYEQSDSAPAMGMQEGPLADPVSLGTLVGESVGGGGSDGGSGLLEPDSDLEGGQGDKPQEDDPIRKVYVQTSRFSVAFETREHCKVVEIQASVALAMKDPTWKIALLIKGTQAHKTMIRAN